MNPSFVNNICHTPAEHQVEMLAEHQQVVFELQIALDLTHCIFSHRKTGIVYLADGLVTFSTNNFQQKKIRNFVCLPNKKWVSIRFLNILAEQKPSLHLRIRMRLLALDLPIGINQLFSISATVIKIAVPLFSFSSDWI